MNLNKLLFKQIDNSALIVFRWIFGLLITLEAWGAIFTGWIKRTLIEPQQTFNFIGLDFLQPLPGDGMYYYYALMGLFGVLVMIGYKYRFSMSCYTVMWACVYLMQKSSYNNHYYLLMLLCFIMIFLPAHRWASVDAWKKPSIKKIKMPRWVVLFIIVQLWIVYTYASVAKLYPDWLNATVAENLMRGKKDYWLVGDFLQQDWVHYCIAYTGILFDLLVIPLLLIKRTRWFIVIASVFFHLFNSFIFQIGIFPYLSLAFILFFFTTETINKRFLKGKPHYSGGEIIIPNYKPILIGITGVWFIIQIGLPLRHWVIPDNVLWTEEGHRLSWRMMLRSKSGSTSFVVEEKDTGKRTRVNLEDYLTRKQLRTVSSKPDCMWQFAQRLKSEYASKGKDIAVYVNSRVKVNGRPYQQFTDPNVDLANTKWDYFGHATWIMPSKLDEVKPMLKK